ncbi:MAG: indole-3-glycerol phosphate synthase TrpC [Clostridiales Family XIII bacterium]|jgi:indole-3-glycerol phosphate synthase|nr:indole-3-glycerol phosphate synthase TrpC [Clostridiales Family XIII bacterium]
MSDLHGGAGCSGAAILDEIAEYTRRRVTMEKAAAPDEAEVVVGHGGAHGERAGGLSFERAIAADGLSFICEVKKASPSKGIIAEDFPYREIAKSYEAAGAAAISVLTEPRWFHGSARHLRDIAAAVDIPVLRKDFIVDAWQIDEAARLGASAVLLIVAILADDELRGFIQMADGLGMSALVEAHDEQEIDRAVIAGARIIGVNNRDLRTFGINTTNSLRLRSLVPEEVLFVSESGIKGPDDIRALAGARTDAVLVGEAMMRAEDKAAFIRLLREASRD